MIESLEQRRFMSVSATNESGYLSITGDGNDAVVMNNTVNADGSAHVVVSGTGLAPTVFSSETIILVQTSSGANKVVVESKNPLNVDASLTLILTIDTGGGNDAVYLGGDFGGKNAQVDINLGAGNDKLNAIWIKKGGVNVFGDTGCDIMIGGAGNDTMFGGSGSDASFGNAGNDIFIPGSGTLDVVLGGPGDDELIRDGLNGIYDGDDFNVTGNVYFDGGKGYDKVTIRQRADGTSIFAQAVVIREEETVIELF